MKWNKYLELSEKTLSTQFHCEEKEQLLLHAVIGVLTEVEELLDNHISHNDKEANLDPVNILEEAGDVLWYLAIIGRMYDIKPTLIISRGSKLIAQGNEINPIELTIVSQVGTPMNIILAIIKETCKMLDMLKKKMYYNKPINEESFTSSAKLVMIFIQDYMNHFNINVDDSFDININKLKARYGDKFSSERAINRDLETEREILEKGSN